MINAIYIFSIQYELVIKRTYTKTAEVSKIVESLKSKVSIVELPSETAIHCCFEDIIICFVVSEENEMYILRLIQLLADALERMLGSLSYRLLVYHFRDVYTLVDSFILNGKVISVSTGDILASVGSRSSA